MLRWAVQIHPTVSELIPTVLLGVAFLDQVDAAEDQCAPVSTSRRKKVTLASRRVERRESRTKYNYLKQ